MAIVENVASPLTESAPLNVAEIKADFPLLQLERSGKPIVYLDSAASSQRPQSVLDAMDVYYTTTHANVHRGVYAIAEEATRQFEVARAKVGKFVNAPHPSTEILFTKNVTEAINLVAYSWGRANINEGDVIVLTEMEHHANLVPWLMLAKERGAVLRYLRIDDNYQLDLSNLDEIVAGAKLVAVTAASNVTGTVNDLAPIIAAAHSVGALVLVDGAQHAPHRAVDLTALGADFYGFTGHKMLGPTGIGALWGREEILDAMPPFLGGGEMIRDVRLDGFTTNDLPWKFEAGTPPIAEAIGFGAAIDYLNEVGMDRIHAHEASLTAYALQRLTDAYKEIVINGPKADPIARTGVISFTFGDLHPHDVAQVLDEQGVCVRAGHHCAKPLMRCLGVSATSRASLYLYNDEADVDALVEALGAVQRLFA